MTKYANRSYTEPRRTETTGRCSQHDVSSYSDGDKTGLDCSTSLASREYLLNHELLKEF